MADLKKNKIMDIDYFNKIRLSNYDIDIASESMSYDEEVDRWGFLGKIVWEPYYDYDSLIGLAPRIDIIHYVPYVVEESPTTEGLKKIAKATTLGIFTGAVSKLDAHGIGELIKDTSSDLMDEQVPLFTDGNAVLFWKVLNDIYGSPTKDLVVFANKKMVSLVHYFNKERGRVIYPEGKDLLTQMHPVLKFNFVPLQNGYIQYKLEKDLKSKSIFELMEEHQDARNIVLGTGLGIAIGTGIALMTGGALLPAVVIGGIIGLIGGIIF